MSEKLTITTIVKKADECVVYHDDGWYCTWKDGVQKFNFELIQKVKTEADGIVLLVSEEEANANSGNNIAFDDFGKWCIPRWLIWNIYGKLEVDESDKELVEFMRGLII